MSQKRSLPTWLSAKSAGVISDRSGKLFKSPLFLRGGELGRKNTGFGQGRYQYGLDITLKNISEELKFLASESDLLRMVQDLRYDE
jgi:hypothetical protein